MKLVSTAYKSSKTSTEKDLKAKHNTYEINSIEEQMVLMNHPFVQHIRAVHTPPLTSSCANYLHSPKAGDPIDVHLEGQHS
jgi:hypothetical protein